MADLAENHEVGNNDYEVHIPISEGRGGGE